MIALFTAATGWLDRFNPLQYVGHEDYVHWWTEAYRLVLIGFWGRLIAAMCLVGAFWFGVYRKMPGLGIVLFCITIAITYMGGLVKVIFWWTP